MPEPMDLGVINDAALRKYLLGNASVEEQEKIDHWLMSEEQAYDLLEAAEDDLIDDALSGRLPERDLRLFNDHFLAAPERQRKFQFSRSFRRAVEAAPKRATVVEASPARFTLLDVFRYRPAFAYAASALMVVLLAGSGWSLFKLAELQRDLRSATDQLAGLSRDRDDLQRQLEQSQAETQALQQQTGQVEGPGRAQITATPVLLAMSLMPGLTRSSGDIPKVTLAANASGVRFSLVLLDDNFAAYRATLVNADGREIWSRDKVPATTAREGKSVVLTVPSDVLSAGDYSFSLMGLPTSGDPENIGRYYFRAFR